MIPLGVRTTVSETRGLAGWTPGGRRASGALEAEVLGTLQMATAPLTPGDVRDRLDADLSYSTVVTILSRLHAKGVLARSRAGRAFAYAPVADDAGLAARRMRQVLDERKDRDTVLARFVTGITERDARTLRRLLGDEFDQ
ncbi:MAG: CopY family transcriptional regulator [Actinoallomurus sp.]|nr:CopY family transcriptional regulator [Actinoallomurus sp.]